MAKLSDFKVGDTLLTYGLDMGCHKCVCTTKVVKIDERGIVTDDGDCRMITMWEDMDRYDDYFLYSEEKEREMQEICNKKYRDWKEACRKQLEEANRYHMERNAKLKAMVKEKGYFDGTHTFIDLSGKTNFYRWKKYNILNINENLDLFGMADDGDTMILNIDDLPVPPQWEIEEEVKAA